MSRILWSKVVREIVILVVCGLAALTLFFGGCYGCSKFQTSEGQIDGVVRKISSTGMFWKTIEMTVNTGTEMNPIFYHYTADDPAVAEQVKALPTGVQVRVHYRKFSTNWEPNGESRYRATKVEVVK